MSICSITPENFRYFRPLLPKSYADSFDNDPYVYGIGHYEGDAARGIILYDMDYENHVAGIRYVAVDLEHQRRGIGSNMLREFSKASYEEEFYPMACFASLPDEPVYGLFEKSGIYTIASMPGGSYIIPQKVLSGVLKDFENKKEGSDEYSVLNLGRCSKYTRQKIKELIIKGGPDPGGILSDADKELSMITVDGAEKPLSMVFIGYAYDPKGYEILYIGADEEVKNNGMIPLLYTALCNVEWEMVSDESIVFSTAEPSVERLIHNFFPDIAAVRRVYIAGYNGDSVI